MAASRLFEQLHKAAAARAAMSPPPVAKPQPQRDTQADDMARDIAALQAEADAAAARAQNTIAEEAMVAVRAAAERERAEVDARLAAEKRLAAERDAEVALQQRVEAERRAEEAARARLEVERIAAQQSQRLADLEREVREAELARMQPEAGALAPDEAIARYPLARGFAVVAVLAALVLGWYFVPWRTPGPDSDRAKPPGALKMDPKLDLGRPK